MQSSPQLEGPHHQHHQRRLHRNLFTATPSPDPSSRSRNARTRGGNHRRSNNQQATNAMQRGGGVKSRPVFGQQQQQPQQDSSTTTTGTPSPPSSPELDCRSETESDCEQLSVGTLRWQNQLLLEENDKCHQMIQRLREEVASTQRHNRENPVEPGSDFSALQQELSQSRQCEAEMTVAFQELNERIKEIDRMIECDPEMKAFFDAVAISPTSMSSDSKQAHVIALNPFKQSSSPYNTTTPSSHVPSNNNGFRARATPERRRLSEVDKQQRRHTTLITNAATAITSPSAQTNNTSSLSGRDSPQSDSGCSLASHMTSATDSAAAASVLNPLFHTQAFDEPSFADDRSSFSTPRPGPQLRRTQSNVTEQPFYRHYQQQQQQQRLTAPWKAHSVNEDEEEDDEAGSTPTLAPQTGELNPGFGNRLRSSFRQSLNWMSNVASVRSNDFENEALAARLGEARALACLGDIRFKLSKAQSRCDALERHVERLENIKLARMSEIEGYILVERKLRQEINDLNRCMFDLETSNQEQRHKQNIKQLEVEQNLAEARLALSHREITKQHALICSELQKADDQAAQFFDLTPSPPSKFQHEHRSPTFSDDDDDGDRIPPGGSPNQSGKTAALTRPKLVLTLAPAGAKKESGTAAAI